MKSHIWQVELRRQFRKIYFLRLTWWFLRYIFTFIKPGGLAKYKILKNLISNRKDDEVYIIPNVGIGDSCYELAFIDELTQRQPDKKFIIIGNAEHKELISSYVTNDRIILRLVSRKELQKLHVFNCNRIFSMKATRNNIFAPMAIAWNAWNYDEKDMLSLIRKEAFHLPENASVSYHRLNRQPITSIQDFHENKNRIAIINPYTNSMWVDADRSIFVTLADELKNRGFIVYTNVVGTQKVIDGTEPLKCSISELYSMAYEIPVFVSIRSGICDMLAVSNINMFVIFPCNEYLYRLFTLECWKTEGRIKQLYGDTKYLNEHAPEEFSRFLDELKAEGRIS